MNGPRVVALREALGWTQRDLARVLSVELVTVRRWERSMWLPPGWGGPNAADPALRYVRSPPKGLAREVLIGIERAVALCAGDAAKLAEVRGRLDLGIGALIAVGCANLLTPSSNDVT